MMIFGHSDLEENFHQRLKNNRWPQALILTGPEGIGKALLLNKMARHLLCESKANCGQCLSCKQFDSQAHPDVLNLKVEKGKKAISIDQIRNMLEWETFKSAYGRGKVILINDISRISEEGQNAMLKVIEEPSEGVFFLLSCVDLHNVLPTIQSRCLVHRAMPLSAHSLQEIARANNWTPPSPLEIRMSHGSAGELMLLSQTRLSDYLIKLVDNLSRAQQIDAVEISAAFMTFYRDKLNDDDIVNLRPDEFVSRTLSFLNLVLEEGARLSENLPAEIFTDESGRQVHSLIRKTNRHHRHLIAQELSECKRDLLLNLPPLCVLERCLRAFLELRFVQKI